MKIYRIYPEAPQWAILQKCGKILNQNGVILHPTETVYGLAARFDAPQALKRVYRLKGRPEGKPFSILVNSIQSILDLIGYQHPRLVKFLEHIFPGPITILLPQHNPNLPPEWQEHPMLGFRLPDHPLSVQLVSSTGHPLITTSANRSGQPAPVTFAEVDPWIRNSVDVALDGGQTPCQQPSTIVQIDPFQWKHQIIREGACSPEKFKEDFDRFI